MDDCTKVPVLTSEGEETFELNPEDEAALLAAIVEAKRGESVSAGEALQKIRGS